MDYDDIHRGAVMHPAVTIFPTLLALGEDSGVSGKDFLTAAVVGYDVANKIGKAHGTLVHARGFHPTGTTGIFASTLAGASILGLPVEQARNAFGMNISQSAGAQQYEVNGSWDKRIHTGLAAHNAIVSLFLAREGYRGSVDPIEGKHGYFALYASKPLDAARVLDGLGAEFEVMNTAVKPYPICRCSHAAIDAVIAFVRDNDLKPATSPPSTSTSASTAIRLSAIRPTVNGRRPTSWRPSSASISPPPPPRGVNSHGAAMN